ncbi:hypothetical protein RJ640_009562 [Escallonia rubra]|uniref:DYW domain-containing protein n=1 Tax=Escallonia rubra TaxID=112253 RepID=A0AA88UMK5_9ASTE|nr:hypothetical protein RJ640_009562 [Escallonia rubra]
MLWGCVRPGNVAFSAALKACSALLDLRVGQTVHAQIVKFEEEPDQVVYNGLVRFYGECGCFDDVRHLFDEMPCRNIVTWNSLIAGFSVRDHSFEAFEVFRRMQGEGVGFSWLKLTTILPVCARVTALCSGKEIHAQIVKSVMTHEGLTDEGRTLFDRMRVEFGISQTLEHYACLMDILGRAGAIKETLEVVKSTPMKPSSSIWGSLLNSDVGRFQEGEGDDKKGNQERPGCSWMQLKNRMHTFIAGGCFEFRNSDEYKTVWNELMEAMEVVGYVADTRAVLHDVNEDIKTEWVCGHSERLATMFGLIHTGSGIPIRITKNLRVCTDCHSWMKYVSVVTKRVIILRDTKLFHHFEEGTCSCKDYW